MMGLGSVADFLSMRWDAARPRLRLAIGALIVALVGLAGLTPKALFGVPLTWPYVSLIAAVGWGRSGLAFGPIILLVLFGFAQDASQAPWGSHGLANLLTFGLAVVVSQTFDGDRGSGAGFALPLACLFAGVALVWALASIAVGHAVRVTPMLAAYFATVIIYMLMAPLFDLGIRRGLRGGAAA
jgi:hypothetical protein